jgi:hypothetical protein
MNSNTHITRQKYRIPSSILGDAFYLAHATGKAQTLHTYVNDDLISLVQFHSLVSTLDFATTREFDLV